MTTASTVRSMPEVACHAIMLEELSHLDAAAYGVDTTAMAIVQGVESCLHAQGRHKHASHTTTAVVSISALANKTIQQTNKWHLASVGFT
jgi:hypothetical protein